jgi:hypothetical protein
VILSRSHTTMTGVDLFLQQQQQQVNSFSISSGMRQAAHLTSDVSSQQQPHNVTPQRVESQFMSMPDIGLQHEADSMQQQLQHQQRGSRHVSPPTGLNLQGHPGQYINSNNLHSVTYPEVTKVYNRPQQSIYDLELRPVDPLVTTKFSQLQQQQDACETEQEPVGPLPARRRRAHMDRENSEKSLIMDNIFGGNNKQQDPSGHKDRFGNSSAMLSVMSLSIGDMQEPVTLHSVRDQEEIDSLTPMFNSSMRFGGERPIRRVPRRTNSGDGNSLDLAHVMDMSVATLGDRLSEFGDESMARMTSSQANMSFSNVFDETERDLYVSR